MKKKIIGLAVMAAIALTISWNVYQDNNKVKLTDLTLSNVEALAGCELNGWIGSGYTVTIYSGCLCSCRQGGYNSCPI